MVKAPPRQQLGAKWEQAEHVLFMQLLAAHGKDWKKISDGVKSRSQIQVRAHAKKYFQSIKRERASKQNAGHGGKAMYRPMLNATPPAAAPAPSAVLAPQRQAAASKFMARMRARNPAFARHELVARQLRKVAAKGAACGSKRKLDGDAAQEESKECASPAAHVMQPMGMSPRAWLAVVASRVRSGELSTPAQLAALRQKTQPRPAKGTAPPARLGQQQLAQRQRQYLERHEQFLELQAAQQQRAGQAQQEAAAEQRRRQLGEQLEELQRMQREQQDEQLAQHAQSISDWHSDEMDRFLLEGM